MRASFSKIDMYKKSLKIIKKIERDKGYLKRKYEDLLGELVSKLEAYPKRLSLEEQGKFILGYYHQKQESIWKNGRENR